MCRKIQFSHLVIFSLLLGGGFALVDRIATSAVADDAIGFAAEQSSAKEQADSSVPVRFVQRRVRVFGPPIGPGPIPPGPIPPFAPVFVPGAPVVAPAAPVVVPGAPVVAPGSTHVRVRVPYFSGDFYVDGVPPGAVVEHQGPVVETAEPAATRSTLSGRVAVNVVLSSNAQFRELVSVYVELNNQLSRLTTGDKWKMFLQLPLEPVPAQNVLDYLSTDAGRERLGACLNRYDRIEGDARFAVVAELPAFTATHEALRTLVDWLGGQPSLAAPEDTLPPPEVLPVPPPPE